jgi:hypothetical protein
MALAATMLTVIVVPAAAQTQANTMRMSCTAAQQLVARQGAAVLRTSATTYNRFVVSRAFCMYTEITEPAFIPTANERHCFIGYTCREPLGNFVR